jgi:hypothetical protein
MATRTLAQRFFLTLTVFAILLLNLIPAPAFAKAGETSLPELSTFLQTVSNGEANQLRGVFVPGIMAVQVVEQGENGAGYISREEETLTRFGMADAFGTVGLLAHNHLAGKYFASLKPGQIVYLIYGNSQVNAYMITQVLSFQANEPYNPYGTFRNLETGTESSAEELFRQVYTGSFHITLQTCIAQGDQPSWGRLFVIAIPLTEYYAEQN